MRYPTYLRITYPESMNHIVVFARYISTLVFRPVEVLPKNQTKGMLVDYRALMHRTGNARIVSSN